MGTMFGILRHDGRLCPIDRDHLPTAQSCGGAAHGITNGLGNVWLLHDAG
ncbi:hypothetical protein BIFGAL_03625 [Bifidobacterium gallicum DSM 20093 = LMG 11596]|uniref:Uncharacterized protein n=1 Tax=Bifidobacterium gallicum DSM 20093 = LMG 11596 TaxID=561180 RepID=D1NUU7_9BIFI|nr:hypothetical protein BIFGAL_03625 [Bifidobacterium gallicum DSM 20093 = LMG 11596]